RGTDGVDGAEAGSARGNVGRTGVTAAAGETLGGGGTFSFSSALTTSGESAAGGVVPPSVAKPPTESPNAAVSNFQRENTMRISSNSASRPGEPEASAAAGALGPSDNRWGDSVGGIACLREFGMSDWRLG